MTATTLPRPAQSYVTPSNGVDGGVRIAWPAEVPFVKAGVPHPRVLTKHFAVRNERGARLIIPRTEPAPACAEA